MVAPKRTKHGSLASPVEPAWHKKLLPLGKSAGSYKPAGHPDVIEFSNQCRRLKSFGVLKSFTIMRSGDTVTAVWWVARDAQWSGNG